MTPIEALRKIDALIGGLIEARIVFKQPREDGEATSADATFHKDTLYPSKKIKFEHPLEEGQRVTALVAVDLVRNGERKGNYFVTDQNEVFDIEQVTKWGTR